MAGPRHDRLVSRLHRGLGGFPRSPRSRADRALSRRSFLATPALAAVARRSSGVPRQLLVGRRHAPGSTGGRR